MSDIANSVRIRLAALEVPVYHARMKTHAQLLTAALILSALPACAGRVPAQAPASAQSAPAPAMKSWLIRLIPPRPTFDKDMTDAEGALMEQHFLYWKGLFDKGVCVFGGPVLDPRGVYGILAVRAASEDEARTLANNDPSVKGGLNKAEVAEMKIAFLPQPGTK